MFLFAKKNEILDEGRDSLYLQVFPWHLYFMREHSLVELTEHDGSAADIMVGSIREVPSIGFSRAGRVFTGEMVLGSGLMDASRARRRYTEPHFITVSSYPTSWAYSRIRQPHQHNHTTHQLTGLVGSTKIPSRRFPNNPPEKQTF